MARRADTYVDRTTQTPDIIYVHDETGQAFVTPDGVGRYWYDSEDEAIEEMGELPVEYVEHMCDWEECDIPEHGYCQGE